LSMMTSPDQGCGGRGFLTVNPGDAGLAIKPAAGPHRIF
jgi:hypothetical protein